MANTFETRGRNSDENEIIPNIFGFQSAGKKYINQNYKRIGSILGIVGADLGSIKKQANQEKKLPDVQGAITLDQINFYREHYGFNSISQSDYENIESDSNVVGEVVQPLTAEQFERNKKLSGWPASYELAKIAKSQNIDLSILSREEYADFAIQNRLMIDDNQLRMSSWQRMCESPEEINQKLQEMRSLINPEAESDFDRFTNEMIQKAGEDNRSIDNEIAVRQGTKNSDHWLFFSINEGANIGDEQVFKSYASLKDLNLLTPDKFTNFMQALRDAGYNGDIKIFQDLMSQGLRLNDQIVMHGASEADAELGLSIADQFFGDSLSDTSLGVDQKNQETGKYNSYSQVLAQKIKDSVQGEISNSEQQSQSTNEVNNTSNLEIESLQSELSRLIVEAANKLEIEKDKENNQEYSSRLDREKIERFTENARQAIQDYQKFAGEHSSPFDNSNAQIQEEYRKLEKIAWNSLYNLAHALDGEIATLPQDRDIQLSHPGGVDTKQYLEAIGYKFDENGDITHITDNGIEIELNRSMKTESLIKSKRPSHILYDKSISLDNDINYQGYLIRGLNQQTPDFIVGVLYKKNLENIIVDETKQINNSSEVIKDPWFEDSKVETAFNKIFVDSLKNKDEISGNIVTPDPWLERTEQPEVETADIPQTHPDFGSVYYQESQRWNYLKSLEEQYKDNPKNENIKAELDQARQTYQDFVDRINSDPNQDKFRDFLALRQSYANEEASNTMDRFRKAIGLSQHNETELALSRERYNAALQELLKTEVSDKVSLNIKQLFADEFIRLRDERAQQTRDLQGPETKIDRLKNRFFKFATKKKSIISGVNLLLLGGSLFAAGTGIGIPVAGAMDVSRRFIGGVMAGVTGRETIRSTFEDANLDLKIPKTNFSIFKYKGSITNLVEKSLKDDYINKASDTELLKIISTLDAYYALNGGRFTELNQQKAYEMATYALGKKVENSIKPNSNTIDTLDANNSSAEGEVSLESNSNTQDISQSSDYMNELLTRGSIDRVRELNKQKNIRLGANTAGFLIGGTLLGSLVADMHRPGGMFNPNDTSDTGASAPKTEAGSGPGGATTGEGSVPKPSTGPVSPNPLKTPGTEAGDALSQSEQLAQDVSSLDSGETIWGEVAKQLGENATDTQIQQAVENLLQSEIGQNSIYELAQGTEGGRALLSQWGIDNVNEMSTLSKDQLYEISRYLAPGKLQGITELNLDNLTPFEVVEPPQADVSEAIAPKPSASTEFTRGLSEALGATNLTEIQVGNILEAYIENDQAKENLYNLVLENEINNSALSDLLTQYGVVDINDFDTLTPDQLYEIAQTVGVENLDKLPGFELNDIILSQFEDAPDSVELLKGSSALTSVNRYVAEEIGNLPYDSNLGKQVLDTYVQTDLGKQWLYDAIVNNPDVNNQNIQYFKEYLRFKDIKSPEEFVSKFNWSEFSGNKNIPTSGFWNQIRLPNGGTRLQPLSTFLKPSQMTGIKEAVRQVLTKQ